jgi:hypothetical protein
MRPSSWIVCSKRPVPTRPTSTSSARGQNAQAAAAAAASPSAAHSARRFIPLPFFFMMSS